MVWDDDWKKEMDLRSILDVEVIDLDVRCEVPAIKNRFLAWASAQLYNWVDGGFFTSRGKGGTGWEGEKVIRCEDVGCDMPEKHPKMWGNRLEKRSVWEIEISELST